MQEQIYQAMKMPLSTPIKWEDTSGTRNDGVDWLPPEVLGGMMRILHISLNQILEMKLNLTFSVPCALTVSIVL